MPGSQAHQGAIAITARHMRDLDTRGLMASVLTQRRNRVKPSRSMGDLEQPVPPDAERVSIDAEINEQRPPFHMRTRQEPPKPAVARVVAVVPHDPVVTRRNHDGPPVMNRRVIALRVRTDVLLQLPGTDVGELSGRLRSEERRVGKGCRAARARDASDEGTET